MSFWDKGLEPRRQNRWYMTFGGGLTDIQYAIKKTDKPSVKVNEVMHKYLNHIFYYPGRVEWNPITVTLASVAGAENIEKLIHAVTLKSGYVFPEGVAQAQLKTISKAAFGTNLGSIIIRQINTEGVVIEAWKLNNPFFTEVKVGDLDYSNDEIVEMSLTISYDWAELNPTANITPQVNTSDAVRYK
jgi:hypothetical protein